MGFTSGSKVIDTLGEFLMAPMAASVVLVQNQGTATVTICGPNVLAAGKGIVLTSGSLPVAIQATHFGNVEDADDGLYAIASGGSATVSWIHGF